MFRRDKGNQRRTTADLLSSREPEEVQSAEFTLSSRDESQNGSNQPGGQPGIPGSLFSPEQSSELQVEWEELQVGFVDDPQEAVKQADQLVATALERIAASFAQERKRLENQWSRGDDVSTEELRIVIQRYRTFLERLLSL